MSDSKFQTLEEANALFQNRELEDDVSTSSTLTGIRPSRQRQHVLGLNWKRFSILQVLLICVYTAVLFSLREKLGRKGLVYCKVLSPLLVEQC